MRRRFRFGALLGGAVAIGAAAACQMVLGDYDVWPGERSCSEHTDCGENELCDDTILEGVCRRRCGPDAGCGDYTACSSDYSGGLCADPLGAPCNADDILGCGSGAECVATNSKNDAVRGYCSIDCSGSGGGPACPDLGVHYACDTHCLCIDDWCEEQFEPFLGDLPSGSGE